MNFFKKGNSFDSSLSQDVGELIFDFDPGEKVCEWTAVNYHPHKRGPLWFFLFSIIVFGCALGAVFCGNHEYPKSDFFVAFTFFFVAILYFWVHRNGDEWHKVQIFKNAIVVDRSVFKKDKFSGYWFVYDATVSIVNLQMSDPNKNKKIALQMGEMDPDFFRRNFKSIGLPELSDKKENLVDLWIRVLKL